MLPFLDAVERRQAYCKHDIGLKVARMLVAYHSLSNEGGSPTDSTATEPCILSLKENRSSWAVEFPRQE